MSFKLDKKVKNKWIKALVSGKYRQGSNYLCDDDTFCCLGVACDLKLTKRRRDEELVSSKFLPEKIQLSLAFLNDIGVPFEMIAGLIDETL